MWKSFLVGQVLKFSTFETNSATVYFWMLVSTSREEQVIKSLLKIK